jgi:iron-sulfur cluster repair protein YtfE (RIC family)
MATPRFNIYTLIHKGLRASLCQQLVELGRLDDTDTESVTQQLDACNQLLNFCNGHLLHENNFIHPLLDEKRGLQAQLNISPLQTASDHLHHEQDIKKLQAEIALIM